MPIITYVWINEDEVFETKSYTYAFTPLNIQYVYKWELPNYRFLVPTYLCNDPFNTNQYTVFCDLYHIVGNAFILDDNNLKQSLLQFIHYDENCEIIQGHDLNLNKASYEEHARLCRIAGIQVIPCEDSYRFSTFNKIYEKIWMTRYILHVLCITNSMCVTFTDLIYHHNGTPVEKNNSGDKSLDSMLNDLNI